MKDLLQDVRYALRGIRRNKIFASVVLLVLALGIGVNTAVFSVVNAEIIKPLPFRDSARLLTIWDTYLPQFSKVGVSPTELELWQKQRALFQATAWYRYVPLDGNLSAAGTPAIAVHVDFTATNFFQMLGVSPLAGRLFTATEQPWSGLISERLWRSRFSGDPRIIGKPLRFNDQQLTITGVIPAVGQFPDWADLWLPNGPLLADQLTNPVRHALGFIARMQAGVNETQARLRLLALSSQLAQEHPKTSTGWGTRVSSLHDDVTQEMRPALVLLWSAASLLLLAGCANIASLLLSRSSTRTKEIAVRTAVGASSWRIARQLLTESLVLAMLGGVVGLIVAKAALMLVFPGQSYLDPHVIFFLAATSAVTGIFFGLAPAVQSLRTDLHAVMKSGAGASSGMSMRAALVVFEIAMTVTLVIGAGLLAKSFLRLMNTDPGFNAKGILTVRVLAPPSHDAERFFRRLEDTLRSVPGVENIAAVNALPLIADRANTSRFNVPGSAIINPDALPGGQIRTATPGYFQTMQISLKAGRVFNERDLNQPVVIINETMAKRFWPRGNPIGQKFINGPWGPIPSWTTIIGVVGDVKQFGLDAGTSFDLYYPSLTGQYLVMRTSGDPLMLTGIVQSTLRSIDPDLAITDVRSMDEIASQSARTRRWTMGLLAAFASVALVLALVGIFGVMTGSVTQRTREIGIRMALGARGRQMLALFLGYGLKLAILGLVCGLIASLALSRTLADLVYGVSTADPAIYISVSALVLLVALIACYLPARKAAKVDPLVSLNYE